MSLRCWLMPPRRDWRAARSAQSWDLLTRAPCSSSSLTKRGAPRRSCPVRAPGFWSCATSRKRLEWFFAYRRKLPPVFELPDRIQQRRAGGRHVSPATRGRSVAVAALQRFDVAEVFSDRGDVAGLLVFLVPLVVVMEDH